MLRRSQRLQAIVPALVALACFNAAAADTASEASSDCRLTTYENSLGEHYFALSVKPKLAEGSVASLDLVVLFDTSASQTGLYREDALTALKSLLKGMPDHDRVKLYAVDLEPVALTAEFVAPNNPAIAKALEQLEQRVPLGSTDMLSALKHGSEGFEAKSKSSQAILYIGDGLSRANWVTSEEMKQTVNDLADRHVSVSTYAIGPTRDVEFIAALANQTGGAVFVDSNLHGGEEVGSVMEAAVHRPVAWPTNVKLPANLEETFPNRFPPLRGDRDTVVIGTLKKAGAVDVEMTVTVNDEVRQLSWNVTSEPSNEDFVYLPRIVDAARKDAGVTLPTLGTVGLRETGRVMLASARNLSKLSSQALASGDEDAARKLSEAALERDPSNPVASTVRDATIQKADATGAPTGEGALRLINQTEGDGKLMSKFDSGEGRFLRLVEDERAVFEDKVRTQVEDGLEEARSTVGEDAVRAKNDLKNLLDMVRRAIDLRPETRSELSNKLESAIREVASAEVEQVERQTLTQQIKAEAEQRQRLVEEATRKSEKVKQLMDRFTSLMQEGRYDEAELDVASQIKEMVPNKPISESVLYNARFVGNYERIMDLRELRDRMFVQTLYQVELSHVPFPDEPPILYPPAEVWEELTLKRQKYRAVDLTQPGGAEERIFAALDDTTELDFVDTPLSDVLEYLEDRHGIQIELDARALDDVGLGSDTPVTRNLRGISLRSALRLMLKDLELTYVVQDEVLQITTPQVAEENLITKVYPVGDLVLPISNQAGANPFMLGGGMGGMGGFGGGMGGGFGARGGGGFGGGGLGGFGGGGLGGFGGGFMAVEDDLKLGGRKNDVPATAKAVEPVKKTRKANVIEVEVRDDETAEQAWDRYFADDDIDQAAVRQTVRKLMFARKFDEVKGLIRSALRNGHPQTWMYEALALAIESKHASTGNISKEEKHELDRALMSAVDFADTPQDVLLAAAFMTRMGLDDRALSLFQEVSSAFPNRPEPYIHGLAAAKRLEDLEGIKWASLGILNQAWSQDRREIHNDALRSSAAVLLKLKRENRMEEAKAFDAKIAKALVRDVIVQVTWTGDADVDMVVEEPAGTACSLRNPRTVSGGVMLGDTFSRKGDQPVDGYSEVYVCPKAFAGQYRVILQRIWGKVTGGTVEVKVIQNYGTQRQHEMVRQQPLVANAVLTFELSDGRRQETLAESQVAQAARRHLSMSREVITKSLATVENSQASQSYVAAQRQAVKDGRVSTPRPRFRGRDVGFRPVITTLPQGANMTATAVISADRRYVRITSTPLFSLIGDVSTFNFATGEGGGGGG